MKLASLFLIVLSFIMLYSGTSSYYLGFHNSDLGWNMKYLEQYSGLEFVDLGINGEEIITLSAEQLILIGGYQQFSGINIMFFSTIVFISALIIEYKTGGKNE